MLIIFILIIVIYKMVQNKLDIELIILREYHFFSYKNYYTKILNYFFKIFSSNSRMKYVIYRCNKKCPKPKDLFLLALAYSKMGTLYNNYAIYYLEKYINGNKYYGIPLKLLTNKNGYMKIPNRSEIISIQWYKIYKLLAIKLDQNLEFEKALKYIDITLHIDPQSWDYYDEPFVLYAQILYHNNDLKSAISVLRRGVSESKNEYTKDTCLNLISKYENYINKNHLYNIKNSKRLRIDINSEKIYDLTTGEIISR